MNTDLAKFNQKVRDWVDQQPSKYRKTALAFGYRCDTKTHSFSGTEKWISQQSRKRSGEGVSERTIQRHLKVFEKHGVITIERRRNGDKNMSSVYHVHLDRFIGQEDDGYNEYLESIVSAGQPELPPMPSQCFAHNWRTCDCEYCSGYYKACSRWMEDMRRWREERERSD